MKSRGLTALVAIVGLTLASRVVRPLAQVISAPSSANQLAKRLKCAPVSAREIIIEGVLGGFRTAVADFFWLQTYERTEARDKPGTEALLHIVAAIDPRPLYFWVNGARIIAYDMPAWRAEFAASAGLLPAAGQSRIVREQARSALRWLEEAKRVHPTSAALWIEQANIELNRLDDPAAAASSYRRASEQPDAPFYAARLYAELLRRVGRNAEALAWLVKLHPRLPLHEEAAGAGLVLSRIRALERELAIPVEQSYMPSRR